MIDPKDARAVHEADQIIASGRALGAFAAAFYLALTADGVPSDHALQLTLAQIMRPLSPPTG